MPVEHSQNMEHRCVAVAVAVVADSLVVFLLGLLFFKAFVRCYGVRYDILLMHRIQSVNKGEKIIRNERIMAFLYCVLEMSLKMIENLSEEISFSFRINKTL